MGQVNRIEVMLRDKKKFNYRQLALHQATPFIAVARFSKACTIDLHTAEKTGLATISSIMFLNSNSMEK